MATKKATPKKKASSTAQKSTVKKPVSKTKKVADTQSVIIEKEIVEVVEVVETAACEVEADVNMNAPIADKFKALKPGALIAEFVGTFVLAGAVIQLATQGFTGLVGVALILAILVVVFGVVSGAHLNPAITIAQYANRKIDGVKTTFYIAVQILGAVAAMLVLTGLLTANYDYNNEVLNALSMATGSSVQEINDAGGVEKYLEDNYGMTVEVAAQQLGVKDEAPKLVEAQELTKGKEWVVLLTELIGAIVFGLGVGYAVFAKEKNRVAVGLAVGVGLLAGLVIGGGSAILNPAIAGAVSAFQWTNPFGVDAMTFWWPVFIYICTTALGITIGVTAYRFILNDAVNKK